MSDYTRRQVDEEQQYLTDLAHRRALKLDENRPLLEALAHCRNEVLEREDIDRLMADYRDGEAVARTASQPRRWSPCRSPARTRMAASERFERIPATTGLGRLFGRIATSGRRRGSRRRHREERLGMPVQHRETVEEQGVEAVLLGVGDHVELLRPLGPDTAVGKFLARSGPGLHHGRMGPTTSSPPRRGAGAGLQLIDERRASASAAAAWRSCTRSRPAGCSPSWSRPRRATDG